MKEEIITEKGTVILLTKRKELILMIPRIFDGDDLFEFIKEHKKEINAFRKKYCKK